MSIVSNIYHVLGKKDQELIDKLKLKDHLKKNQSVLFSAF